MQATAAHQDPIVPSASIASAVAALFVDDGERDRSLVLIPRPEIHLVARLGRGGVDIHAFGARHTVHRKHVRAGQRSVTVRLQLAAAEAVLGVPAAALAERIVPLAELWGEAATQQLCDRLATADRTRDTAAIVESAIAERIASTGARCDHARLALAAAARLASTNVNGVALDLGVSERHLRRVFRAVIGVSPKTFAKLARFHRALRAAREPHPASWASIATATGYYDQAHLIDEFRAIAGVTPRALVGELGGRSLRRDSRAAIAQHELLDLAGGGLG